MKKSDAISKVLSRNDTGETGGHQAGILIPRQEEILSFFPKLTTDNKNPRHIISFHDKFGEKWKFTFIYYNNSFFGGTRNEYRLTGMTRFISNNNLKCGDSLTLTRDDEGMYNVFCSKRNNSNLIDDETLKLGSTWKVISI